jgi:hypothetical protein
MEREFSEENTCIWMSSKHRCATAAQIASEVAQLPDFSVVLFRPNFMLASEEHPMKAHKNQWLLTMPSPRSIPCGATNQGTHHGVWRADAFAVT